MVRGDNTMRKKWDIFDFINIFLLGLFCIIIIYPFLHMAAMSLSDRLSVLQGVVTFYPIGFTFDSYIYMLENKMIPQAFFNTFKYTIIGTAINVFFTAISAYPLAKRDLFGRKYFIRIIVITLIFSGGTIPNYLLVASLGMLNSMWSLIIPQAIYGLYLIMAITFYQTIPLEIEESAFIDGASCYRILFSLIIPLSKPVLAALVLFYSMYHYNNFFSPLIYLQDKNKFPLQIVLRNMIISSSSTMTEARGGGGYMALNLYAQQSLKYATIFISIIPILIFYPLIQKHFIKGVMIGAVKG